ncbi:hypothetical protein GYMLUDRAFT_87539 [Collybiopsis luxurians FD-317 M1]|uniref:Glycopeptide n=1 Tax=Collybiopsis luxurians FD-317 M1 TaxID=944289 RepID=A0A0D0CKM2_9AGAR|nr:hypothetical protein GYMLUDRAFT_87539 [Collybiopsis luxurians FD-317 M1]
MHSFFKALTVIGLFTASSFASPLQARGESHTITFVNNCGKGTPQLVQSGKVLSTGQPFTSSGPFEAGIAYLQTGECGLNGDKCTTLEMTLKAPPAPGAGSSTDVTLIAPHAFNVGVGFKYANGCDGQGQSCETADCHSAFRTPTDYFAQTQCEEPNVNLVVTFC